MLNYQCTKQLGIISLLPRIGIRIGGGNSVYNAFLIFR